MGLTLVITNKFSFGLSYSSNSMPYNCYIVSNDDHCHICDDDDNDNGDDHWTRLWMFVWPKTSSPSTSLLQEWPLPIESPVLQVLINIVVVNIFYFTVTIYMINMITPSFGGRFSCCDPDQRCQEGICIWLEFDWKKIRDNIEECSSDNFFQSTNGCNTFISAEYVLNTRQCCISQLKF